MIELFLLEPLNVFMYAIDIIGRDIGEYQSYYGIKDTETTYV